LTVVIKVYRVSKIDQYYFILTIKYKKPARSLSEVVSATAIEQ